MLWMFNNLYKGKVRTVIRIFSTFISKERRLKRIYNNMRIYLSDVNRIVVTRSSSKWSVISFTKIPAVFVELLYIVVFLMKLITIKCWNYISNSRYRNTKAVFRMGFKVNSIWWRWMAILQSWKIIHLVSYFHRSYSSANIMGWFIRSTQYLKRDREKITVNRVVLLR